MTAAVKRCRSCCLLKPLGDYPSRPDNQDGLATRCASCSSKALCHICLATNCDRHQVPPVCVCDRPDPDVIGECRDCRRPYWPQVDGFTECRDAWRLHLDREAAA